MTPDTKQVNAVFQYKLTLISPEALFIIVFVSGGLLAINYWLIFFAGLFMKSILIILFIMAFAVSYPLARVVINQQKAGIENDIAEERKKSWQRIFADIIMFLLIAFSFLLVIGSMGAWINARGMNSFSTEQFTNGLIAYMNEHGGSYPDSEKWCDLLYEYDSGVFQYNLLHDNDTGDNLTRFILNDEAVKLGKEAPSDMVMLFQGDQGWNQSGGREMISDEYNHLYVVFVDGNFDYITNKQAKFLRWNINEPINDINPNKIMLIIPGIIFGVLCLYIIFNFRYLKVSADIFSVIIPVPVVLGAAGGFVAEIAFYATTHGYPKLVGVYSGLISALLLAICYMLHIVKNKAKGEVKFHLYLPWVSVFTGVLCSSLIHMYLMYSYYVNDYSYLIVGCGFGFLAGLLVYIYPDINILRPQYIKSSYNAERVSCEDVQ